MDSLDICKNCDYYGNAVPQSANKKRCTNAKTWLKVRHSDGIMQDFNPYPEFGCNNFEKKRKD